MAVCLSILGTSLNPLASNQGALAQSNPSPKVLSGAVMYQWQEVSGTSTAHFVQSLLHWGTCTHKSDVKTKEKKEVIEVACNQIE